jgi:hypothetical protein
MRIPEVGLFSEMPWLVGYMGDSQLLITHKFSGSPAFLSDEHWGVK